MNDIHFKLGMLTVNVIKDIKNKYINIKDIHFKLGMLAVNVIKNI